MTFIQFLVALIVILNPITALPAYLVLWPHQTNAKLGKTAYKIAGYVAGILLISYIFGNILLQLIGLDIIYFRIAGGLIITWLGRGFVTGTSNLLQVSEKHTQHNPSSLLIPLTMPMIAGPGAISYMISNTSGLGVAGVLIAIAISSVVVFYILKYGYQIINHISQDKIGIITKMTGLLLLGIGLQIVLSQLLLLW